MNTPHEQRSGVNLRNEADAREELLRFALADVCKSEPGRVATNELSRLLDHVNSNLVRVAIAIDRDPSECQAAVRWLWGIVSDLATATVALSESILAASAQERAADSQHDEAVH